jgi:tRNA modification GTPase
MDTIFALATARGRAGLAVVRISGPGAFEAVRQLAGRVPEARRATLMVLRDADGGALDSALVLAFPEGGSFTGEPTVEFQLHGAVTTVAAVLRALSGIAGFRPAEAGEFTRRALANGRMDLAQVEGLADLLDSETEAQRRQALRILSGAVGERAGRWRRDLIRAAALLSATIDFADEDVPVDVTPEVLDLVGGVLSELEREIAGHGAAERIRGGFEVAILGAPNAGKSTLLNALAGREAAITSEHAGTTRDVIEVRMEIGGLAVTLLDTAGLREADDPVERIGIDRALARAKAADLRLFLLTGDDSLIVQKQPGDIEVIGKADLLQERDAGRLHVSGTTGEGLGELVERVRLALAGRVSGAGIVVRERHRAAATKAASALLAARAEVVLGSDRVEFAADELRSAVMALDSLIGRVDVEDLLDEIFSSFCIGK